MSAIQLIDWHLIDDPTYQRLLERTRWHAEHRLRTRPADGLSLGMVFFNPSLRTRTSMELAMARLGGVSTVLQPGVGTWGMAFEHGVPMDGAEAEHIRDAFGVLARYCDALAVRVFAAGKDYAEDAGEARLRAIYQSIACPAINLESAFFHPCQQLADAAALSRALGDQTVGRRFVLRYAPHPKALPMAVPNSALLMATRLGMNVVVSHPTGFELDPQVLATAAAQADRAGGALSIAHEPEAGLADADAVYVKAWGGRERYTDPASEASARAASAHWQYDAASHARTPRARVMHCLPVRRNVEIADAVLDGPDAIHLDQAEFRLYAQMAILEWVLGL